MPASAPGRPSRRRSDRRCSTAHCWARRRRVPRLMVVASARRSASCAAARASIQVSLHESLRRKLCAANLFRRRLVALCRGREDRSSDDSVTESQPICSGPAPWHRAAIPASGFLKARRRPQSRARRPSTACIACNRRRNIRRELPRRLRCSSRVVAGAAWRLVDGLADARERKRWSTFKLARARGERRESADHVGQRSVAVGEDRHRHLRIGIGEAEAAEPAGVAKAAAGAPPAIEMRQRPAERESAPAARTRE